MTDQQQVTDADASDLFCQVGACLTLRIKKRSEPFALVTGGPLKPENRQATDDERFAVQIATTRLGKRASVRWTTVIADDAC